MKIKTVTYRAGYKLSQHYNSLEGAIESLAEVEEGETPSEAYRALYQQVRAWLRPAYNFDRSMLELPLLPEQEKAN